MHGDKDPLVPFQQSTELHEALQKTGVPSELVPIPGAGHGGGQFNQKENLEKIAAFFEKTLKN
jgi:dipeptidyl aminopeptidase/acylaminoacyl peptidase